MIYTELTIRAMNLAYNAHHGQFDKGGVPYIFHPIHLAEQMDNEISTCVALLHDTVEDTAVTLEQLAAFLYRYVQYKAGETEIVTGLDAAMAWAQAEGLLDGMEGVTTPDAPALRVQIAHMLLKVLGK